MNVLARIEGQPHPIQQLQAAAKQAGRAYLFTGGGATVMSAAARAFAAAVICEKGCGECSVCSRIERGIHPDVQIIEPEGYTFPLELIRETVAAAAQTPLEAASRVFIIEEADKIVERSQNALLKALEEPGRAVTWVLLASSLDSFLPTVLSRCRIVRFQTVGEAGSGGPEWAVRASGGDAETARALASDEAARSVRDLAYRSVLAPRWSPSLALAAVAELGEILSVALARVTEVQNEEMKLMEDSMGGARGTSGARKRLAERHKRVQRRLENDAFLNFLKWLAWASRDALAVSAGRDPAETAAPDHAELLRDAGSQHTPEQWLALMENYAAAQRAVRENAIPSLAAEAALLRRLLYL